MLLMVIQLYSAVLYEFKNYNRLTKQNSQLFMQHFHTSDRYSTVERGVVRINEPPLLRPD